MFSERNPTVSVIVPNYNHARFLRKRIDSILAQTLQDFELIVLDDCSTDESKSTLDKYADRPRVRIEFNAINSGSPFKQWNKGVGLARAEYVWIAESDDYSDERFLEKLVAKLDAEPASAFAYCRSWRVALDNRPEGFADAWYPPDRWTADYCADGHTECRNYLVRGNIIPNASAVVFRKTVYERVGGADESLRLCGDWKLWASMAMTGKVAYVAAPLNYFRCHHESLRNVTNREGTDVAEMSRVRWWILDQETKPESRAIDEKSKLALANRCMDLAFDSYPGCPDITCLALERLRKLGGTSYVPRFATWRGELLKQIIGWKATRRVNFLYHRYWARNREF